VRTAFHLTLHPFSAEIADVVGKVAGYVLSAAVEKGSSGSAVEGWFNRHFSVLARPSCVRFFSLKGRGRVVSGPASIYCNEPYMRPWMRPCGHIRVIPLADRRFLRRKSIPRRYAEVVRVFAADCRRPCPSISFGPSNVAGICDTAAAVT